MTMNPSEVARRHVLDLADDPKYRPYVVGYLLSCLDERHWEALVQSALEYVERVGELQAEASAKAAALCRERG